MRGIGDRAEFLIVHRLFKIARLLLEAREKLTSESRFDVMKSARQRCSSVAQW